MKDRRDEEGRRRGDVDRRREGEIKKKSLLEDFEKVLADDVKSRVSQKRSDVSFSANEGRKKSEEGERKTRSSSSRRAGASFFFETSTLSELETRRGLVVWILDAMSSKLDAVDAIWRGGRG